MEGQGKPRNLDNFAVVSRGILRNGPRNLAKFSMENLWALLIITIHHCAINNLFTLHMLLG